MRSSDWSSDVCSSDLNFAAHLYSAPFARLARHPRMVSLVEQLFDEPVYMHQFKINGKNAFDGDVWQWPQAYEIGRASCRELVVSVLFYLCVLLFFLYIFSFFSSFFFFFFFFFF